MGNRISAALLLVPIVLVAESARSSSLVFDFETGAQGWTLGTVERVADSPLGGEFAIRGSGGGGLDDIDFDSPGRSMSIQLDLTGFSALTYSQLNVSAVDLPRNFIGVFVQPVGGVPCGIFCGPGSTSLIATAEDPSPNPDLRIVDLSALSGLHQITFVWGDVNGIPYDAYIDDVTFHAVPEPGAALLFLSGAILVGSRLRSHRRAT